MGLLRTTPQELARILNDTIPPPFWKVNNAGEMMCELDGGNYVMIMNYNNLGDLIGFVKITNKGKKLSDYETTTADGSVTYNFTNMEEVTLPAEEWQDTP